MDAIEALVAGHTVVVMEIVIRKHLKKQIS